MSKKYLIDENESHTRNGFRICEECDAKEVEVLDDEDMNEIGFESKEQHHIFNLSEYLKPNNLLIVKIIE